MLEALFVATAKAAPAANAAASDAYDWKWLVPVATLILGFGLKWFQDHVTEKGRRRHEKLLRREQRYDALRMRRLDAERSNLLAMQPLVVALFRAGSRLYEAKNRSMVLGRSWADTPVDPELQLEPGRIASELVSIRARLHSTNVVAEFDEFIEFMWDALSSDTVDEARDKWRIVQSAFKLVSGAIGEATRHLEDEDRLLGDPPAN
jgi:hypothetical protein